LGALAYETFSHAAMLVSALACTSDALDFSSLTLKRVVNVIVPNARCLLQACKAIRCACVHIHAAFCALLEMQHISLRFRPSLMFGRIDFRASRDSLDNRPAC
jgi:hypothetical protein